MNPSPGPGYRFLAKDERVERGDEFRIGLDGAHKWLPSGRIGKVPQTGMTYRRKLGKNERQER